MLALNNAIKNQVVELFLQLLVVDSSVDQEVIMRSQTDQYLYKIVQQRQDFHHIFMTIL